MWRLASDFLRKKEVVYEQIRKSYGNHSNNRTCYRTALFTI